MVAALGGIVVLMAITTFAIWPAQILHFVVEKILGYHMP
jgi:hypothetical protein